MTIWDIIDRHLLFTALVNVSPTRPPTRHIEITVVWYKVFSRLWHCWEEPVAKQRYCWYGEGSTIHTILANIEVVALPSLADDG